MLEAELRHITEYNALTYVQDYILGMAAVVVVMADAWLAALLSQRGHRILIVLAAMASALAVFMVILGIIALQDPSSWRYTLAAPDWLTVCMLVAGLLFLIYGTRGLLRRHSSV